MSRSTERINHIVLIKTKGGGARSICYGCDSINRCVKARCEFYYAIEKLAKYEDTGLEPEEVKQLNASDASKEESSIKYYNEMRKYRDELKYYKKLEAQGLLIKLPCRVGSIVWCIDDTDEDLPWCIEFDYWMIPGMCKTVFLTREEAEKALEASNGERT